MKESQTRGTQLLHSASNRSISKLVVESLTISLGRLQVLIDSEAPGILGSLKCIYSGTSPLGKSTEETPRQTIVYKILRESYGDGASDTYTVVRGGETLYQDCPKELLVSTLEWDIRDTASKTLTGYHLIHAGAVAHNGHGILLPADSGAGKSTAVAALTLDGFTYCSDEMAVVGPERRLYPFPKIISLKLGGWRQILHDFPQAVSSLGWPSVSGNGVWQVRPPLVASWRRAKEGYPVNFVILPHYVPGAESSLQPIAKSVALKALVEQSLDLQIRKAAGFKMLVELVKMADCYSLSVGDLKEAVTLVKGLTV